MRRLAPLVGTVAAFLLVAGLAAQEPPPPPGGISDVISGSGFTKIKIAIPDPTADAASQSLAKELGQTIRDDLDFSGYFDVLDPAIYPLAGSSPEKELSQNGRA
jgi:hypothetical protein